MFLMEKMVNTQQPILYIAIGVSGAGKSTTFKKLKEKDPELNHFSWDALRLQWYGDDYAKAWERSCQDRSFKKKADKVFESLLAEGRSIYVDNTNLTVKRRKPMIEAAKKLGYQVVAIMFDIDLKTAIARQTTRGDKYVNAGAVKQQFESLQPPAWQEFDKVYESSRII